MENTSDITILYVDDESMNLFLFEKSFESYYTIITAISGEEGLKKLQDRADEIIVVISDMRMPGMSGIEFIQKAREQHSNIAYFILTGFEFNEEINQALEAKMIHKFFTKPFNIDEIKAEVNRAVAQIKR